AGQDQDGVAMCRTDRHLCSAGGEPARGFSRSLDRFDARRLYLCDAGEHAIERLAIPVACRRGVPERELHAVSDPLAELPAPAPCPKRLTLTHGEVDAFAEGYARRNGVRRERSLA